jgi:hypothetical protein
MATVRSYQPMCSVKLASGFLCPTRVLAVRSWIVSLADGFAFVFSICQRSTTTEVYPDGLLCASAPCVSELHLICCVAALAACCKSSAFPTHFITHHNQSSYLLISFSNPTVAKACLISLFE